MRSAVWIMVVVMVADQVTKWMANEWLTHGQSVALLPSLNLALAYNSGAAFGLLNEAGGWQRWFFIVLAVVVSVYLWTWMRRLDESEKTLGYALALIVGGALGNMVDRLFWGYVVDFIDVYYEAYHWPTFNVADSAIVLGAVWVVALAMRDSRQSET